MNEQTSNPEPATSGQSGATVTVALKHPRGLILRLHKMVEVDEPVMGGGTRTVQRAMPVGEQIRINGYSQPNAKVPPAATAGAFALTHGVPKDFWEAWKEQNADHPYLLGGLLFASDKGAYAARKADEREELKSGLEPLNPEKLPVARVKTYEADNAA